MLGMAGMLILRRWGHAGPYASCGDGALLGSPKCGLGDRADMMISFIGLCARSRESLYPDFGLYVWTMMVLGALGPWKSEVGSGAAVLSPGNGMAAQIPTVGPP